MIGRFRHEETLADGQADADPGLAEVLRATRASLGKSLLDVQRELKIKASYIAAIESADPAPFETPGFIAGYVRSYARYLGLDPEWTYRAFCAESGFTGPGPVASATPSSAAQTRPAPARAAGARQFGGLGVPPRSDGILARIELGAIGSVIVLVGLIAVLGYGGYAVLNEVQKVQLVPVEAAPEVVADIDPLDAAEPIAPGTGGPAAAVTAGGFDRLYRPDPLEVPVIIARDGPIATLDPAETGALAGLDPDFASASVDLVPGIGPMTGARDRVPTATERAVLAALGQVPEGSLAEALPAGDASPRPQVVTDTAPEVVVFAVRPSWVRIRSAEGTTLYEAIMEEGDRFVLPATEEPASLRTGESGAIYFSVAGTPYGPAGRPGAVTGNVSLAAASLTEDYDVADPASDTALSRVVVELQADPPRRPGAPATDG